MAVRCSRAHVAASCATGSVEQLPDRCGSSSMIGSTSSPSGADPLVEAASCAWPCAASWARKRDTSWRSGVAILRRIEVVTYRVHEEALPIGERERKRVQEVRLERVAAELSGVLRTRPKSNESLRPGISRGASVAWVQSSSGSSGASLFSFRSPRSWNACSSSLRASGPRTRRIIRSQRLRRSRDGCLRDEGRTARGSNRRVRERDTRSVNPGQSVVFFPSRVVHKPCTCPCSRPAQGLRQSGLNALVVTALGVAPHDDGAKTLVPHGADRVEYVE